MLNPINANSQHNNREFVLPFNTAYIISQSVNGKRHIRSIFTLLALRKHATHTCTMYPLPITHINLNISILFYRTLSICTDLYWAQFSDIRYGTLNMSLYFMHAKSKNRLIIISGIVYILIATLDFPWRLCFHFSLFPYRNVSHSISWVAIRRE